MTARRFADSVEHGETRSVRVVLAEEIDMFRTALVSLLSKEKDIEVVADVRDDPKVVISLASRHRPDVTVVAVNEEDTAEPATVRALREGRAKRRVVALTVGWPAGLVGRLMVTGVSGLIDRERAGVPADARGVGGGRRRHGARRWPGRHAGLGPRQPVHIPERDVSQMAAKGASGPEIAKVLWLSSGTVRHCPPRVMNKIGVRNRVDAIRSAKEAGWF